MKIGLPKALLYYRYGVLWETFFAELGCETITSGDTNQDMLVQGVACSVGECCLPVKLYMGHVISLLGHCDYIMAPRFENFEKNGEFCIRFWGLPDIVRSTFPHAPLIGYDLQGQKKANELLGFLQMGKILGKGPAQTLSAYRHAKQKQARWDAERCQAQTQALREAGHKILLATHPYIIHDPLVGGPLVRMLRAAGGTPVYTDRCDLGACRKLSKTLSKDLYWSMNQEIIGAIAHMEGQADGVILISAFPCGTDSLVNELVMRRAKHIPMAQIVLDEQQGEAGLQTRIECFMDVIKERKQRHVS